MAVDRRTFLRGGAAAGGLMLAGPFRGFTALAEPGRPRGRGAARVLRPVADKRDGMVRLHLPPGFQYRSFHDTEFTVELSDGTILPGRHDGMAAFPGPNRNTILVRNHEVNGPVGAFGDVSKAYDPAAGGGTTTIEVTDMGQVVRSFTSLNGTQMNCSGGPVPWGSWITCEETVNGPDVGPDFTGAPNALLHERHGYIFEVPANGESNRQPITKAGRFAHEAVEFAPDDGNLYMTEDNFGFPSGFYRYVPPTNPMSAGRLEDGGVLQMLKVKGQSNADLAAEQPPGATYDVEWVTIDDPDPQGFSYDHQAGTGTTNNDAIRYVGDQGRAKGAAIFSRLEGMAYENGTVFFVSTQGGGPAEPGPGPSGYGNGWGQVWAYDVASARLRLVFQSPNQMTLDMPDNVTTSPRGALVLCEDSSGDNYLRGLHGDGQLTDIALNRLVSQTRIDEDDRPVDRFGDEFAGSTFSPNGRTLFVNIQASDGMSFAIWGPWSTLGL